VWEQRQILLNIPDASFPCGDVALLVRVVKVFTANGNPSVIRIGQARDAIEHCRFSGARSAKENREAGKRAKVDIEDEGAFWIRKAFADANLEIGRDWLNRGCWIGLRRGSCWDDDLYRHGPTAHGRRFRPYRFKPKTVDSTANEMISSTSAVWFALE
jgi:hypothetical protein